MQNNQLTHYGVLGMKWGVRKNPTKAYNRAIQKKNKLENKYAKTNLKSAKLQAKATKQMARATTKAKAQKAQRTQFKAAKLNLQSAKLQSKSLRWAKQIEKTFSNYEIRMVTDSEIKSGKKYVYEVLKRGE